MEEQIDKILAAVQHVETLMDLPDYMDFLAELHVRLGVIVEAYHD